MGQMNSSLYEKPIFRIAGDRGLLVEYGRAIDVRVNEKVRSMAMALEKDPPAGVIESIPAFCSILLLYDPLKTTPNSLKKSLTALEKTLTTLKIPPPKTIEIPVCYGGEYGPDIAFVADNSGLTIEDVVRLHAEPEYVIHMVGFAPGFPFLGGLPETLYTPRLETPRTHVPEGSVGIANNQTGVYPVSSPGGWRLIGRTPQHLFDPQRTDPIPYRSGDRIRFRSISQAEYERLAAEKGLHPRACQ